MHCLPPGMISGMPFAPLSISQGEIYYCEYLLWIWKANRPPSETKFCRPFPKRPLKNRSHLRFYTSRKLFQKISVRAVKNLSESDRWSLLFRHSEPNGEPRNALICEAGYITPALLEIGFYPAALGRIFIPLNTLKAACLNQASRLFLPIVVNCARLALSWRWLIPKYCFYPVEFPEGNPIQLSRRCNALWRSFCYARIPTLWA
jgi:hypothetical protein